MEEQATFEARAVLAVRRPRLSRLGLLVPVIALVAIAWAGVSGAPSDPATTAVPEPTAVAAAPSTAEASAPAPSGAGTTRRPTRVVGLAVQRLDEVRPRDLGEHDVVALAGWYVATAITDCPRFVVIDRPGSLPDVRRDFDHLAYCQRSGVLFASRPEPEDGRSRKAGLPAVVVSIVKGVVAPPELEVVGAAATEVVVIGRFVESLDGCRTPSPCPIQLVVDHVGWTPGA